MNRNLAQESGSRPDSYDGTQLVVEVELPSQPLSTADVYRHVYGLHLDDGAKPWPYYRDASSRQWGSLASQTEAPLDRLVWMISLDQLRYRSRRDAELYLVQVYEDLEDAAAQFGGVSRPECSVDEALQKMDRVRDLLAIRDARITIVVRAPEDEAYSVDQWWDACEQAGLQYGDGNLFWLPNNGELPLRGPDELFCVEPYTQSGYFHVGDRGSPLQFPDVAFSFRIRDFAEPEFVLERMAETAERLASLLGAELCSATGAPFHRGAAQEKLQRVRALMQTLQ